MSLYEKLYLALVVVAFLSFIASLAGVLIAEGRRGRS